MNTAEDENASLCDLLAAGNESENSLRIGRESLSTRLNCAIDRTKVENSLLLNRVHVMWDKFLKIRETTELPADLTNTCPSLLNFKISHFELLNFNCSQYHDGKHKCNDSG